MFQEGQIHKI